MNKTLSILFATRRFPPSVGGMERFAYDLHNSLKDKVDVKLIKWSGKNRYLALFMLPVFFIKSCWILSMQKIDIIHMQDGVLSTLGVVLKFIFRKPLVVVIHGLDVTFDNKIYQAIIPWALKRADRVICISNAAREEVIKRGILPDKAVFVPLGITDDIFMNNKPKARSAILKELKLENKNTKIILSTGRLVKRKGVNWFIEDVMSELVRANDDLVFVISGDGQERESIENSISKKKLQKNVFLLGRTSDELLRDLYNGSDLFVMPNITVKGDMEGFGRVLLEASVCELPVVASGIEGIKDAVINGKNGVLVKERDKSAFINEINKILNNEKASMSFAKKSRNFALENYSWRNIAEKYTEVYKSLDY